VHDEFSDEEDNRSQMPMSTNADNDH
jgi:hypothetical protein